MPAGTFMDAALIRPGSSLTIASTTVDVRGQFVFERVPPGNYEVGVNAYLQGGPVSARQAIVTSNGVATEVTVVLKLTRTRNPGREISSFNNYDAQHGSPGPTARPTVTKQGNQASGRTIHQIADLLQANGRVRSWATIPARSFIW